MKMMQPRIHVHISAVFSVFALADAHCPNAYAPPERSIREMMPPISPQTMISHAMSSDIIVARSESLNACSVLDPFSHTMMNPTTAPMVRASMILFVMNM